MSEKSDFAIESSVHPKTQFNPSRLPTPADGPVTVMNPERGSSSGSERRLPQGPGSTLIRQLFPTLGDPEAVTPLPLEGIQLGHFRIEARIGSGGMGAVFRAVDERLERVVALKVLAPSQTHEADSIQRFRNEARAAARLDHDNIARVHYTGEDHGLHFIAFEYVTGTNLRDMIQQNGRLNPEEAVNYALQIATALKHTAAAGVVHRDIKPSNIIITPSGRAKLVDLGLARKDYSESVDELTVAGTTLGTFDYISPEQAKDPRKVDVRSDIYSLGCTLYHMLTGEPPYPDGTFFQRLLDHKDKQPPNPAAIAPNVPPALTAVVQKMMAGEPRLRYAGPDDLIRDLMLIAGQMGLRGINPEGLVWATSQTNNRSFWERHLGWIVSATALALIVVILERFPSLVPPEDPAGSRTASSSAGKNGTASGQQLVDNGANAPGANNGGQSKPGSKNGAGKTNPGPAGLPGTHPGEAEKIDRKFPLDVNRFNKDDLGTAVAVAGADGATAPAGDDQFTEVGPRVPVPGTGGDPPTNGADSTTGNTTPAGKSPPAVTVIEHPVTVESRGRADSSFPTLEAACVWAKDGDVIVLRFDGTRRGLDNQPVIDKPITIVNKKITIRADASFRPQIEFKAKNHYADGFQTRMISVSNGSVDIINVDFVVRVDDAITLTEDARWALFSLHGADHLRLEGVNVSFVNPSDKPAAVVELTPKTGLNFSKMKKMMKTGGVEPVPAEAFDVEFSKCFVRGDCGGFHFASNRPGRIDIKGSIMAIEQSLLHVVGDGSGDMPPKNVHIELKLDHATCLVGNGLVRMEAGDTPRELLPVHVFARNNIIASNTASPLIAMSGNVDPQDFRRKWLRWNGVSNFYEQFKMFWTMTSTQSLTGTVSLDFTEWKRSWGDANEVGAHDGGVAWLSNRSSAPYSRMRVGDFKLDPSADAEAFPAGSAANDGSAVGVNFSDLRDMPKEKTSATPE